MELHSANLIIDRDWSVVQLNLLIAANVSRIFYRVIIRGKSQAYIKDVTGSYVLFIVMPLFIYAIIHFYKGFYL
jgi:hypothetical protein